MSGADQVCKEKAARISSDLESTNPMRIAIELGSRGDGIHHPWMDTMKRVGVKEVSVGVRFLQDGKIPTLQIGEITYFREYKSGPSEVRDANELGHFKQLGLQRELERFVLAEAQRIIPPYLRKEGYKRAHGIFPFVLLDDECLPAIIPPPDVVDDELTELMRASDKGDINKVRILLQTNADVNKQDVHGMTALMYAAGGGIPK
jgi:hypothetical protein